ncbi:hypothetical protein PLICRDRAFT_181178 [Plicaturopsis crispa FD-325 SS-3]|uniref:Uncharacterized protein n=1 Tax=Plicaturopsis crispa FD-325 SS-3 TaxID=944288 RepID=A0A0C9T0P0_PLICR|nr:hypothetical protein PLICRDRAFT_181178 [Plicaturopsis crispa FD-325 SS-3]
MNGKGLQMLTDQKKPQRKSALNATGATACGKATITSSLAGRHDTRYHALFDRASIPRVSRTLNASFTYAFRPILRRSTSGTVSPLPQPKRDLGALQDIPARPLVRSLRLRSGPYSVLGL